MVTFAKSAHVSNTHATACAKNAGHQSLQIGAFVLVSVTANMMGTLVSESYQEDSVEIVLHMN